MTSALDLGLSLLTKLTTDANKRKQNTAYYRAEYRPQAIGMAVPPALRDLMTRSGYARKYVDSVNNRLKIQGFRLADSSETDDTLWSWWQGNNMDAQAPLAHNECLVQGLSFIVISRQGKSDDPTVDTSVPRFEVVSPKEMYAEIDPLTGRVIHAVRVTKIPGSNNQYDYLTVYQKNTTHLYQLLKGAWTLTKVVNHKLGITPVVPMLNRSDLTDRLGSSQITPEIRDTSDLASRTTMNMGGAIELMGTPQRVFFGIEPDKLKDQYGGFAAYLASILTFDDPDGNAHQFSAADIRNFVEALDRCDRDMAKWTGLPPEYFSVTSDNPASADAIKAAEVVLINLAEMKQVLFGEAWEQAMRIGFLVMGQTIPKGAFRLETIWRNAGTPTRAAEADASVKLATSQTPDGRSVVPVEQARIDMGYSPEARAQMEIWDRNAVSAQRALAQLVSKAGQPAGAGEPNPNPEDSEP